MSTDYAAKEREFLDSLEADTGRDLAGWMRAIDDSGMPTRNDIIDWLRLQGFLFARASWLERIHHNDGRPLYGDKPAGKPQVLPSGRRSRMPARTADTETAPAVPPSAPSAAEAPSPPPVPAAAPPAAVAPAPASADDIETLLARAKAYRPLAQYLMREVEKAAPGTGIAALDGLIVLSRPDAYALIATSARDIRLALDLDSRVTHSGLVAARLPGADARFRHMLILTDARQLDGELIALIKAADAHVNAPARAVGA